jgi:hypothetical protein
MPDPGYSIERVVHSLVQYKWLVILTCLAVAVACATGAPRLQPASDYRVFFTANNPQLQAYEALRSDYTNDDNILLVIDPPGDNVFTHEYLTEIADTTRG